MAGEIQLDVVTPEAVKYSGTATQVQLPGALGEMGVLPHHAPLVSLLKPGLVTIYGTGANTVIAVAAGFVTIANNTVVCLVDDAAMVGEADQAALAARRGDLERQVATEGSQRARDDLAYVNAQLSLPPA